MTMRFSMMMLAGLAVSAPVLAHDDDWRDRRSASPREVARSWDRVQDERRDLARAQWRGDREDIREERRELRRAEREFREDRRDLYRAGWGGGPGHGHGWGPGGRPGNDWGWRQDGWSRPGWHAEHFYRQGNYRPYRLGWNDPVWRGYDNRYYCRRSDGTTGLIVGGIAGGVLGNVLAPGGSKTLGSIIGGVAGAAIGNSIDRGRVICQ
jgi:hypothetical protein